MRLTSPACIAAEDADLIAADVAAVTQSSLTMTPLGELRYGAVPALELTRWLEACYKVELHTELKPPRINRLGNDQLGQDVTRTEFLVIRDLDLEPLSRRQKDGSGNPNMSEGRIVAYAEFQYHPPEPAKIQKEKPQTPEETPDSEMETLHLPALVHRDLREHWNNVVEAALKAQFGDMHCFEVRSLSTLSPSHLRKGVASKLLKWIFPWADGLNVPVVLAATPPGYPLYLKHGFVPVGANGGAIECNLADWGGSGVHKHILMVRLPEKAVPA